jgi:DNA-binding transcriptional MocR family regulator
VLSGDAAGLQTPMSLPPGSDEGRTVTAAARCGVDVYPIEACYAASRKVVENTGGTRLTPGLLLGFAALPEDAIDEGIRRLADALAA